MMANKLRVSLVQDISLVCSWDIITAPCSHSARRTQHPHTQLSFSQLFFHPHFSTLSGRSSVSPSGKVHIRSCCPCYMIGHISNICCFLKARGHFWHPYKTADIIVGGWGDAKANIIVYRIMAAKISQNLHSVFLKSTFCNYNPQLFWTWISILIPETLLLLLTVFY